MGKNIIECPYCDKEIDYANIMGDSDWDDQSYDWYDDIECPYCHNRFKAKQYDIEIIRYFESEKR